MGRSFRYVGTNSTIDTFLVISLVPEDVKNRQVKLKLLPQYSPAIILTKDEDYSLTTPWILYNKKNFQLSYKDLEKHILKISMWKVSYYTFNTYHGIGTQNLWKIATENSNLDIKIKQTITPED